MTIQDIEKKYSSFNGGSIEQIIERNKSVFTDFLLAIEELRKTEKNNIFYRLGNGVAERFYDYSNWRPNTQDDEKIKDFIDYYEWRLGNTIVTNFNEVKNSEEYKYQYSFSGRLKEESIKSLENKLLYLRGVVNSDSNRKNGEFHFANSIDKMERCIKFLLEIYNYLTFSFFGAEILRNQGTYTPICNSFTFIPRCKDIDFFKILQ